VDSGKRPTLLVGSVNLPTRDDVFGAVSEHLKDELRSVPDGETGERRAWLGWQGKRIKELPGIEVFREIHFESPVAGPVNMALLTPEDGVDLSEMSFGPFNYEKEAGASYQSFKKDREAGMFPEDMRFQVSMPTPMMFAMMFPKHRTQALTAFERDLGTEIGELLKVIPAEDLAIQWDVAGETQLQERIRIADDSEAPEDEWLPEDRWPMTEVTESIARVSDRIPETALLGVHFCYGDAEGKHPLEPRSLALCVDMANSAAELIERRLDWVHMPVPIERTDDAYFAPLANLKLQPDTQLYLGLLHKEDGIEGARKRIERAASYVEDFGVATECGMGREPSEAIPGLLALHHEAALV